MQNKHIMFLFGKHIDLSLMVGDILDVGMFRIEKDLEPTIFVLTCQ